MPSRNIHDSASRKLVAQEYKAYSEQQHKRTKFHKALSKCNLAVYGANFGQKSIRVWLAKLDRSLCQTLIGKWNELVNAANSKPRSQATSRFYLAAV